MRRTRLVFAPARPEAAPTYLLLDEQGQIVGRGEQSVQTDPAAGGYVTVLAVPGAEVAARWLRLPAVTQVQARAAAALMMEDQLALGDEPVALAVGPQEPDGWRLVCTTARTRLEGWLSLAKLYGLTPDVVIPDHLLAPEPADGAVEAVRWGETLLVRGPRLAFAAEPDLAPVILGAAEPAPIDDPEAAARRLAAGALQPAVNLLQGDFAPADPRRVTPRTLARAGVLAALLALSPVLLSGAAALRQHQAALALERDSRRLAATVLPQGAAVEDPVAQAGARLTALELAAGGGPAGLAADLFRAISVLEQAQVESLIISPDGALRATVSHADYADTQALADALRPRGVTLRELSSREAGDRVVSEIMLGARR